MPVLCSITGTRWDFSQDKDVPPADVQAGHKSKETESKRSTGMLSTAWFGGGPGVTCAERDLLLHMEVEVVQDG